MGGRPPIGRAGSGCGRLVDAAAEEAQLDDISRVDAGDRHAREKASKPRNRPKTGLPGLSMSLV
jgi:hypothetical protein